jgi:hypothetical protein
LLEATNEPYAIAKISIVLCEAYRVNMVATFSAMPTKPVRSGDNYHLQNYMLIPAKIRSFMKQKKQS